MNNVRRSCTVVALLKACAARKDLHKGILIHADIGRKGLLEMDVYVGSALVNMYAKCGALIHAQEVIDTLVTPNVVSWNALITGYAQHGHGQEALSCFEQMQQDGVLPDAVTFSSIFKACGTLGTAYKGQEMHSQISHDALLKKDTVISTALVDMYAKCGLLTRAKQVFAESINQNVISWTALISGYVQHRHAQEALVCFEHMVKAGLSPNGATYVCVLNACSSVGFSYKGQVIHADISRLGLLREEIVATALVDMYSKCGLLAEAKEVLEELPTKSIDSWNALIAGYVQNGLAKEALNCFKHMQHRDFFPDSITVLSVLKACGSLGAGFKGQELHSQILLDAFIGNEISISTALMDMYSKCGFPERAKLVYDELQERDVLSWNAAISGCAQFGENDKVLELFEKLVEEGKEPDVVTFTLVFNVCSHKGLVDRGQMCFGAMFMVYGITPTLEHHACMIDLLSRAGSIDKSAAMVQDMPFLANLAVWRTLLGACLREKDMGLGRVSFEHMLELNMDDSGAYVCMRNIYHREVDEGSVRHF